MKNRSTFIARHSLESSPSKSLRSDCNLSLHGERVRDAKTSIIWFVTVAVIGMLFSIAAHASEFIVPALKHPVIDNGDFLSPEVEQRLDQALVEIKRITGGTEIAVLTVTDLGGATIEQRSIQVVDQWKLGARGKDNGVLLMLARDEKKVRIEVGRGFEGDLTDAYSKRIIDQVILPLMRQGNSDKAIVMGVAQIAQKIHPELDVASLFKGSVNSPPKKSGRAGLLSLLPLILIVLFFVLGRGGRRGGSSGGMLTGMMIGSMLGGGRSFGGRSSGFGGGFGGGGGFSGGGASGGW